MGVMYNQFTELPFIPYKIAMKLLVNEDIWKILKYIDYDCLSKPNLTRLEKLDLICNNEVNTQNYRVFLSDLIEDAIGDGITLLSIYERVIVAENHLISTVGYEFDIMIGGKTSLIYYQETPCSRSVVLKMLILQVLNGTNVNGVGELQFNKELSRWCSGEATRGNNKTYTGCKFIMATQISTVGENAYG